MVTVNSKESTCFVSGRLSHQDVITLMKAKQSLIPVDTRRLDLSQIEYCDSAGVAMILEWVSDFARQGKALKLASPSKQLQKLVDLYDLNELFDEEFEQGKEIHGM